MASEQRLSPAETLQYYYAPPTDEIELTENMTTRLSFVRESVKANWNKSVSVENLSIDHVQFVDCETFLGGEAELRKEYLRGLKKGLQCLSEKGAHRRADALAYLAVLEQRKTPISIVCYKGEDVKIKYFREQPVKNENGEVVSWKFAAPGVITNWFGGGFGAAMATTMGHKHWPTSILSVVAHEDRISKNLPINLARTLFHEGIHWLGYRHKDFLSAEPDLTTDAAECCIEQDQAACKSLESATYDPSPYLPKDI